MIARGDSMGQMENENLGIACRKCECNHVPAYRSERVRLRVKRYRQCRNCGYKFITYESISGDVRTSLPLGNPEENKG